MGAPVAGIEQQQTEETEKKTPFPLFLLLIRPRKTLFGKMEPGEG
jgi:hypothetical protein